MVVFIIFFLLVEGLADLIIFVIRSNLGSTPVADEASSRLAGEASSRQWQMRLLLG
jgi:hypothetical protein